MQAHHFYEAEEIISSWKVGNKERWNHASSPRHLTTMNRSNGSKGLSVEKPAEKNIYINNRMEQ